MIDFSYIFGILYTASLWLRGDHENAYVDLLGVLFSPILVPTVVLIMVVNALTKKE